MSTNFVYCSGYCWVDVRDVALAHFKALETPAAENTRILTTANEHFNNRALVDAIRKNFPEYEPALPSESVEGGRYPAGGTFKTNNSRSVEVLGIKYHDLEASVVDTVKSFKAVSI
jgi:nucleoside-diphosphate-sugar epimerase